MDNSVLDKVKVNFILGPGRSGTALLMWILNSHPQCLSTPEIKHTILLLKKHKNITEVTPELIEDLEKHFPASTSRKDFRLITFSRDTFFSGLKTGDKITYAQLCKKIYLSFSSFLKPDNKNVTTIFDKNPVYTTQTHLLKNIFGNAKFLFLIRDPRAFVLSSMENYSNTRNIHLYSLFWRMHINKMRRFMKNNPDRSLLMRYEDLIKLPEDSVKKIFDFFEVPFTPSVLEYHKEFEKHLSEFEQKIDEHRIKKVRQLSKPINSERVSSWETKLSKAQIKRIEFWCSEYGKEFSYKPSQTINIFEKLFFFIEGAFSYLSVNAYSFLVSRGLYSVKKKKRKGFVPPHPQAFNL